MFKGAILTFICCILFVTGKPNLIFLEGTKKLVSSIKIIRDGTNFTVTCIIEDLKSKRKSSDLIFWINDDLRQRSETNSITLYKPGTFYCICDKYKLVRRLHLVVRDKHDFVRRKRSDHQLDIPRESHTVISPKNYPDPVRDLIEGSSKTTSNTSYDNVNDYIDKYFASLKRNYTNYGSNYRDNLPSIYQDIPRESHPVISPINYPDPVRDLIEGPSKTTLNTSNDNVNDYLNKYYASLKRNYTNGSNYRDYLASIYQDIPRESHPVISPINYPDPVRDLIEGPSKTTLNTSNDNVNDYLNKYYASLKRNYTNGSNYRDYLASIYQDIPRESHPVISPINYPDSVKDLIEGLTKTTSNTNDNSNVNDYDKYLADLKQSYHNYGNYRDNFPTSYQGVPRDPYSDIPTVNYPDPVRDFFEGPSKTTSNTNHNNVKNDYIDKYLANSGGSFGVSNNNNNNFDPNYRDNLHTVYQETNNDDSHPIYVPQHKDGFNVIYFFAIVLAFVIISLLIYCLSKRRTAPVTNARSNENGAGVTTNPNNRIEYCSHVFCERYRSTNPEMSCYLASLNSSGHMPLSSINHDDGGVTILTSLITSNNDTVDSSSVIPYSDSPPAYGISTTSLPLPSTEDVPNELDLPPPSYHQAVANMNLDPPPDFDSSVNEVPLSTTSTSLPNVNRTREPLERS